MALGRRLPEGYDRCFSPRLWLGCRWFVFGAPSQLLTSLFILAMVACIEAVQPDRSFPRINQAGPAPGLLSRLQAVPIALNLKVISVQISVQWDTDLLH